MAFYLTDCLLHVGFLRSLLYINDFEACALSSTVMMYADDTFLTACSHDLDSLEMELNNDLNKAQLGLQENKLTANAKKSTPL